METITDDNGVVLEKLSFDPWGRRRNPTNWSYNTLGLPSKHFDRGYTMHSLSRTCFGKHHDVFGLINMNGRMYDPWVGRMLSPDPFMQDPTNTQNYNRYTYALNNPLKYIDPSGYIHGSVFKPGDWDTGIGAGGALYINTWFNNDYTGNAFGSYEDRHTYSYDNSTETWTNGVGQQVSPKEVYANKSWTQEEFNNFVEENSVLSAQGESAQKIYEGITSGLSYFSVNANGNNVLISAYGALGTSYTNSNGALGFTNPTAAVHMGAFSLSVGGVNWTEVGSTSAGIVLGIIEIAAGLGGEIFTGGVSTGLIVDGAIRIGSNGVKLYFLLSGNTQAGVATPSNVGGWVGKSIDMSTGKSYYDISYGQGIGSFSNDFTTFIISGGSAASMSQTIMYPSVWNVGSYGATLTLTPYTATSDLINWKK